MPACLNLYSCQCGCGGLLAWWRGEHGRHYRSPWVGHAERHLIQVCLCCHTQGFIIYHLVFLVTNPHQCWFHKSFLCIYQNGHCRRRLGAGGGKTKPFMSISFWSKEASLGDRGGSKINELLWRLLICQLHRIKWPPLWSERSWSQPWRCHRVSLYCPPTSWNQGCCPSCSCYKGVKDG